MKGIFQSKDQKKARFDALKVWWVIGASTGIGKALVEALDRPHRTIYISARNGEALDALADRTTTQGKWIPLPFDIINQNAVKQAAAVISAESGQLDGVVINAGTCEYMDSWEIDLALAERVMQTNFQGALNVVSAALPLIRKSNHLSISAPQLVFMSSSVTYQALPRAGAYGGSKAALRYFAECLKLDLQQENIDVRVVSPGFVKTPLTDKNDFPMPFIVDSSEAARAIIEGLEGSRFDIHFPKRFTWMLKLIASLPAGLKFSLLGKLSRHKENHPCEVNIPDAETQDGQTVHSPERPEYRKAS